MARGGDWELGFGDWELGDWRLGAADDVISDSELETGAWDRIIWSAGGFVAPQVLVHPTLDRKTVHKTKASVCFLKVWISPSGNLCC